MLPHAARRRLRRALGRDLPRNALVTPPSRPIGGKLELTYACNLRCGFCYTDSPRHTLARTPELSDEQWLDVADQLVELGAIEAVVTGGEPLLRRDLTLEVCHRLAAAGLGVTLNSNGWFIDDAIAAALAEAPGLHVHVSIDGPSPELHDASRGIPGSWRRAIGALDALIRHGIAVHSVCVVTRENVDAIEETLGILDTLGVGGVRLAPVTEVGAAAREGGWSVDITRIERATRRFRERTGSEMAIGVQAGDGGVAKIRAASSPAALLVRPNGAVRADSIHPFRFGHAIDDGLAECWERIKENWEDPAVTAWRRRIETPDDYAKAGAVPYLDDEVEIGAKGNGGRAGSHSDPRAASVPRPVAPARLADGQAADPAGWVAELALARRYRAAPIRAAGDADRRLVRRLADGRVWELNRSASLVLDALSGGTPADALGFLAATYREADPARLQADAIAAAQRLARWGLVIPENAGAPAPAPGNSPSADLPA